MLKRPFGPRHTFQDALLILEAGLRSGEITLNDDLASEAREPLEARQGADRRASENPPLIFKRDSEVSKPDTGS